MFEFGDKYRGKYDESLREVVKSYYVLVSGYMDELLWVVLWFYKVIDNFNYFIYVIDNVYIFGGIGWVIIEFSWDVKFVGV